jgi:hypothetical protein
MGGAGCAPLADAVTPKLVGCIRLLGRAECPMHRTQSPKLAKKSSDPAVQTNALQRDLEIVQGHIRSHEVDAYSVCCALGL